MVMKLSILIPSIPSRLDKLKELVGKIEGQIGDRTDVELIVMIDNKIRTIGDKRTALKSLPTGLYWSMIDDDDDINDDFVDDILHAIETNEGVDVITFNSMATIEGVDGKIIMSIYNSENEQWSPERPSKRQPFHMCAWRTDLVKDLVFDPIMYGEDAIFSKQATELATTEHHIDKILHHYIWERDVTEAFDR